MLHLCTLIFQYDIHKNALKSQYYYPDLIELQNAPLTYSLCFHQHYRLISDVPCMATFFLERTHPSLLLHQPVLEHKADHSFIINSLYKKTLHIMKYTAVDKPLSLLSNTEHF